MKMLCGKREQIQNKRNETITRRTFNASAVEILVFCHVIIMGIVEQRLRRYAADIQACSTKRVILLHTNSLRSRHKHTATCMANSN